MTGRTARAAVLAAAVTALALVPLVGGPFAVDFVTRMMVSSIFALSLELLVGAVDTSARCSSRRPRACSCTC